MFLLLFLILTAACSVSFGGGSGVEQTKAALEIQSTRLSLQQTEIALNAANQSQAQQPPPTEPDPTQPPPTEVPPTQPPSPTQEVLPTNTVPVPTPTTAVSMEEKIQSANILVYDDSHGSFDIYGRPISSRVEDALAGLGLTGSNVVKVKDAMGDFLSQLNSGADWDLIIVAAESRNNIRGEFWEAIYDRMLDGSAVVAELWYLDQINRGKIYSLLNGCGFDVDKSWDRLPGADLNNYLIYILEPDREVFQTPNTVGMLIPSSDFAWVGDVGDLVKLTSGGDAVLLAGALPNEYQTYGLITECMQGRVIFQTFDTHDYKYEDTVALWENYIIYTLTNHFEAYP
jgi:hypothetical protein